jgi:murein DD-endopeptidase MepM/ murein hydrolase activator NlpD
MPHDFLRADFLCIALFTHTYSSIVWDKEAEGMLGGMRKWKERAQKATNKLPGSGHGDERVPHVLYDDENPWLSLSHSKSNQPPVPLRPSENTNSQHAPSRWIGEDYFYPAAETSAELQKLDQTTDRAKTRPAPKKEMSFAAQNQHYNSRDTKSVFFMQCIFAGIFVLAGLYMHQTDKPFAKTVDQFTSKMLETDYTDRIIPVAAKVFDRFHLSLPTFGVHAAVFMHVPLDGKIDADFSADHPEIWIQGTPNAPVFAAGSGIVTKVQNKGQDSIVEIDHGALGKSIYTGLGVVTVHANEYVDSGQVIGRMPQAAKNQDLRFALTKGGKFENPHDYIHFSAADEQ